MALEDSRVADSTHEGLERREEADDESMNDSDQDD